MAKTTANKTVSKQVPEELHKAIVLFIAAILALLVSRFDITGSMMSLLLAVIAFVLFLGSFYFVLKWSGLWGKLKKS